MSLGNHWRDGGWRRAVALLALTAALARALIPVGFMPASVHGTVQIMFCEGGSHHHDGGASPGHDDPVGRHASDQGPCPFALSGAAPLLPEALSAVTLAATVDEVAVSPPTVVTRDAPNRYAAPRGPPARA